jgi:DICT domain-containing protein
MSAILGNRHASVAVKGDLVAFSRHLERLALASPDPTVILAALQHVRHFTPATRRTYDALGRDNPLVAVFGVGVDATPGTGLRGVALQPDDPLTGQWHVVVLGAQFAGALIAEDLGDTGEDLERRFRYRITFDRDIVIEAARPLADRILPTTD